MFSGLQLVLNVLPNLESIWWGRGGGMGCSTGEARGGGQHNTVEPPSALTPPRSGPYCRWVSAIGAFMSYLYSTLALALSAQQLSTGGMATDTTAFGGECFFCVCVCVYGTEGC